MRRDIATFIRFCMVGATCGFLVHMCVLYSLTEFLGIWYFFSGVISAVVSITTVFLGNKFWSFRSRKLGKGALSEYWKFWLSSMVSITLQLALLFILVQYLVIWYMLAAAVSMLAGAALNFSFNRRWVFADAV